LFGVHASVEALGRKLKLTVILHAGTEIVEKPKIASLWVCAGKWHCDCSTPVSDIIRMCI